MAQKEKGEALGSPFPVYYSQKSNRNASCPVRLPALSAVCTVVICPKESGADTLTGGGAKFGWFGRLVNVASKRIRSDSLNWKVFDRPPATAVVPGPTRLPTAQFPMRPAPGIGLN